MSFLFLYSLKRFWRKKAQVLLTSLFLCLGFWGWLMSESSQTSIRQSLETQARQILSADVSIESRREFTPQELDLIRKDVANKGQISSSYEFFAMLNTPHDSRLVLVRAVEDTYPFYGKLKLEEKTPTSRELFPLHLWASHEFKGLMNLKLNEKVHLGDADFNVSDFVLEDPSQTFRLANLAPTVFIHLKDLKKTNLIQFGSTFTTLRLIKINPSTDVDKLAQKLKQDLKDPAIDISTYKSLPDEMSGPTQRLSDFLGLSSLVTLLFCGLSLFYLLQIWSLEHQKEKAALAIFGLSRWKIQAIEFFQSVLTALLSTILSTGLVFLSIPLMQNFIREWLATHFILRVTWHEISFIWICQIILLIALTFPFRKSGTALFRLLKDSMSSDQSGVSRLLPLLLTIWPFAIYASRSWKNGTYFFVAILGVCFILIFSGWIILNALRKIPWTQWTLSYPLQALSRQSTASWAFIVTAGICASVLNLMPQLQNSFDSMMTLGSEAERPSLFMFDIQQEQFQPLQKFLDQEGFKIKSSSPLVRARILKINGKTFERIEKKGIFQTREDQTEERFRNRSVNLTYRTHLTGDDKIIEGEPFSFTYESSQKYPFISVEQKYLNRLHLHIGDILTFDVQGIEISAEIKNVRSVQWSRFDPNFFIVFQNGILNEAPHTYLASTYYLTPENKIHVIRSVSKAFPNISIVDIERLIRDIIQNLKKISGALRLMTGLSFLTGLLAIVFLLISENNRRATEIHLLKVLGGALKSILRVRHLEVLLLSSLSLIMGLSSSYLIAYFILNRVFQLPLVPEFSTPLILAAIILGLTYLTSTLITFFTYQKNSFVILKKEE